MPADTHTAKILIVEDNQENTDLLVYFLHPQKYDLVTASDGHQALKMTESESPDLVLLDIMLPGIDGFQVCERLKKNPKTMFIPVIMITALKELKDKIKSLEVGADDFITKPFENVELLARVKSLLRLSKYHRELETKKLELEEKTESLMRMDKFKEELINLIVHDMKNPLFVIQGNLQMMSMGLDSHTAEYFSKYTKRIERSSQQLLRMVVNLLDISRMQEGIMKLKKDVLDFNKIVVECVNRIKDYSENENKDVIMRLDETIPNMLIDHSIMDRVVENIINFSINNVVDNGKVIVSTQKSNASQIRFSIQDNGAHIPEKFQDKIFEKFSQTELKNNGLRIARGLGLIFCKMAVEAHGGRLWIDKENTDGNLFHFELPLIK
jgi:two-component system sensor histidine kinase/response regulator